MGWSTWVASSIATLLLSSTLWYSEGCHLIAGVEDGELGLTGGGGSGNAAASGGGGSGGSGGVISTGGAGTGGAGGNGATGPTYAEAVLADSPLAYWRLGEDTTPTAVDATGNGHDGTYVGGITVSVPGAIAGDPDTAVDFDGHAEVTIGDVFGFEGRVPFSVEAWIKPEIDRCSFIGKSWHDGSGYRGWLIYFQGTELTIRRGEMVSGPEPTLDQWTHVVSTYDGFTLRLYQNGELSDDRSVEVDLPQHSEPFTIGRTYQWVAFQGAMDEVAVYGVNLSAARIKAHYDIGVGLR